MISSVCNNKIINNCVIKPMNYAANHKWVSNICTQFRNDNIKFITGMGLTSIMLKDGLGCYMYVKQSLNNKKIPEDKRKFVAALDLANGGLMIILQLVTFLTISRDSVQKKIFNKLFETVYNRASRKGYQNLLEHKSGKEFAKVFTESHSKSIKTLGMLTSLVAAAIIAKRVFVPFIATPLAEKTKKYLYGKDDKNTARESTESKLNAPKTDVVEIKKDKEATSNQNTSSKLLDGYKSQKA